MITDFVLNALFGGLNALLSLAPSWTMPGASSSSSGLDTLQKVVAEATSLVPLDQVALALTAYYGLGLALAAWDGAVWVYHQFWGSS